MARGDGDWAGMAMPDRVLVVVGELGWPSIISRVVWKPMLNHVLGEAVCLRVLFGSIGLG